MDQGRETKRAWAVKVGDRVIYRNGDDDILDNEKAEVICINAGDVQIRFENIKACSECGTFLLSLPRTQCPNCGEIEIGSDVHRVVLGSLSKEMTWWTEPEYLTIDKEWLREERLKELGL